MKIFILTMILITSVIMIVSILLQDSKSDGLSGVIGGGAEQLFGKKKSSGYDGILHKITVISSILFFITSLTGLFILG